VRPMRHLTSAVTVATLAFGMLAGASPAGASSPGFHATWVAQSAYATGQPGQVIQMSAVYANTGDEPWIRGQLGTRQADFGTNNPRDNTALSAAGWAAGQGWLTSNRFAAQSNDLVATGQTGSWVWNAKVPTGIPTGDVFFYGNPVIDGVAWMEDYGFFLKVTVQAGPVTITQTLPASPSTTTTPVVQGLGAGAACAVTINDGAVAIASGTSDGSGNFSISVGPLAAGSHNLSASSLCSGNAFRGSANVVVYTVTTTGAGGGGAGAATSLNTREILITFGQCVSPASTAGGFNTVGANDATNIANYNLDGGGAGVGLTRVTMNGDNASVTVLTTAALANPSGHTIVVSNVINCSLGAIATITAPFIVNDQNAPSLSVVSASALSAGTTTAVTAEWNEPVGTAGSPATCSGTYNIDGIAATSSGHPSTSPSGQRQCTLTAGTALAAGTTHTLQATNEKDQGNNTQSPNPQSISFTVATIANLVISSMSGTAENVITISWNGSVSPATGTPTCTSPTPAGIACAVGAPADGVASHQDVTLTTPFSVAGCSGGPTSCVISVSITGVTGPGGATMVPATQSSTATIFKDTTPPTISTAAQIGTTQNTFDLTWSEKVSAPLACVAGATCAIRIKDGTNAIVASTIANENAGVSLTISACDNVAADKLTRLTLLANGAAYATCAGAAATLPGANYTITVDAAVVNDLASTPNPNTGPASTALTVVDSTNPTVVGAVVAGNCGAGQPCTNFTFTFSEKMATTGAGSVLDTSHYKLNTQAITGVATINPAGTVVTLVLTSNAPCAGPGACAESFTITGATDASLQANVTSPNPFVFNFTRTP
jgi:hypothetical protein